MRKKVAVLIIPAIILWCIVSCRNVSNSYYPLNEDLEWTYLISKNSSIFGAEGSMKMTVTNLPKRKLHGKTVTPQKIDLNGNIVFIYFVEDHTGIFSIANQTSNSPDPVISEPDYTLHFPIQIGSTYEIETKTQLLSNNMPIKVLYKIESNKESVTVPAGTFENCLKIRGIGSSIQRHGVLGKGNIKAEYLSWFAPGAGQIKAIIKEESNHMMSGGGSLTVQLESFKK